MKCSSCGFDVPPGMTFCGACGAPLAQPCPACRFENPPQFRFCGRCGAELAAAPEPAPPARPETAERRHLTVLFCDLVSSTALAERLDPEHLREVVRHYQTACAEAIEPFGGHIAQYLGDGVLVYFGYPQAHEDDAHRAVHAGLAILQRLQPLNERLQRERDIRVEVRIGIHTGPVVAGTMGAGGRSEQLAVGQTPNIAARLQGLAEPDTVVISASTYALVQGFFACEPLGAQALKGLSQPLEAYRVLRDTGVTSRFEVEVARGLSPLVGRQRELRTLLGSFERVRGGRGEVVSIVGEAGVGKSRLVQTFHERIAGQPHVWLLCRCSPYSQHSAFQPIVDLLHRLFGFEREDPPAVRRAKLTSGLATYDSLVPDAMPLFASFLSVPLNGGEGRLGLAPERQKERTLEALLALFLAMSAERPVVGAFEDVHWADPSTLEFLDLVTRNASPAPVLTLVTHRPVFQRAWRTVEIGLDRLDDEQVIALIEHLAGDKRLPPELVEHIVQKTDGVPIFVEELTKMVLESGFVVEGEGGYELTGPLPSLSIPATLRDSLLARLDRLGPAKDVAQLGAVLGREFSYEMLQAVGPDDEATLRRNLAQLVDAGLLLPRGQPPAATYTFKHALIQEAAYELLLTSTRRQHHQRVAVTLAERFPEVADTRPELLAHHFTQAVLVEPAVTYWLQAGRRAVGRSANVEATDHARQGLALVEDVPPSPQRDALELALQATLGSATIALKGYGAAEVEQAFGRALALCERLGDPVQLFRSLHGLWTYYVVRASYDKAIELADRLVRLAEMPARTAPRIHALYCVGFTRFFRGELVAARDALEAAVAIECDDGDPELSTPTGDSVRIHVLSQLALSLWHLGHPEQAAARAAEGIALARAAAHPYGLGFALVLGAYVCQFRGENAQAKALAGEGVAIAADKGYRFLMILGGFLLGWLVVEHGQAAEGFAQMRRSLDAFRTGGARVGQTTLLTLLADSSIRTGRIEEATEWLDEGLAAVKATGEAFFEPELHRLRGECALAATGARDRAEECFGRALEIAQRQGNQVLVQRAAGSLARLQTDRRA